MAHLKSFSGKLKSNTGLTYGNSFSLPFIGTGSQLVEGLSNNALTNIVYDKSSQHIENKTPNTCKKKQLLHMAWDKVALGAQVEWWGGAAMGTTNAYKWILNDDGTVSPVKEPALCVGWGVVSKGTTNGAKGGRQGVLVPKGSSEAMVFIDLCPIVQEVVLKKPEPEAVNNSFYKEVLKAEPEPESTPVAVQQPPVVHKPTVKPVPTHRPLQFSTTLAGKNKSLCLGPKYEIPLLGWGSDFILSDISGNTPPAQLSINKHGVIKDLSRPKNTAHLHCAWDKVSEGVLSHIWWGLGSGMGVNGKSPYRWQIHEDGSGNIGPECNYGLVLGWALSCTDNAHGENVVLVRKGDPSALAFAELGYSDLAPAATNGHAVPQATNATAQVQQPLTLLKETLQQPVQQKKQVQRNFELCGWEPNPSKSIFNIQAGAQHVLFEDSAIQTVTEIGTVESDTFYGKSKESYIKNVANKVACSGSVGEACFQSLKASIEVSAEQTGESNASNSYFTKRTIAQVCVKQLNTGLHARSALTAKAKQDLDNAPFDKIFKEYGPYFIIKVSYGAMIISSASVSKASSLDSGKISAELAGSYKSLAGSISSDGKAQQTEVKTSENESLNVSVQAYGGDPLTFFSKGEDEWLKTVTGDKNGDKCVPVEIEFEPLYELAPESRQQAMKVAWVSYIQDCYSQAGLKNEKFYTSVLDKLVRERESLKNLRTEILLEESGQCRVLCRMQMRKGPLYKHVHECYEEINELQMLLKRQGTTSKVLLETMETMMDDHDSLKDCQDDYPEKICAMHGQLRESLMAIWEEVEGCSSEGKLG